MLCIIIDVVLLHRSGLLDLNRAQDRKVDVQFPETGGNYLMEICRYRTTEEHAISSIYLRNTNTSQLLPKISDKVRPTRSTV